MVPMMKAAVVRRFAMEPQIEEVVTPKPGPEQVVVKLEASGVCHTDIHLVHGRWPVMPKLPFVPGHEGVGIVQAIGRGVQGVREGERIAIPWQGYVGKNCYYQATRGKNLHEPQGDASDFLDGGYSEYVRATARYICKVPPQIGPLEAAPLTCAGVTAYNAVKVSRICPGDLVAVFGIGGPGHLALQYAKIAGASVVAVDFIEEKLELARKLGADYTINSRREDPGKAIQRLGGAAITISTMGSPQALEQVFHSLQRGGTLILVALPAYNYMHLPLFEMVLNRIRIISSLAETSDDLREVFALHAAGKARVIYEVRCLEQINECFAEVEQERILGELVFDMMA